MRGHGDSDWDPQGAYLVEDYVKDIEGLVAQLQLRNIVLWGNSTGGRVAQVFAGSHPELVSAVIVEDVGPERPREISDRLRKPDEPGGKGLGFRGRAARADQEGQSAHFRASASDLRSIRLETTRRWAHRLEARSRDWQRLRAHRAMANRPPDQGADHLYSGRSEHHRSGGNPGAAQAGLAAGPDRHDAGAGSLSQRREACGFPCDRRWISFGNEGWQIDG